MIFHVYILQSLVDGSYYIGYTKNLNKRLLQHNKARTGYTARKNPWKLVYYESFEDKSAANKRERFLKNQKSHDSLNGLITLKSSFKSILPLY
jgi:putative endonuclease